MTIVNQTTPIFSLEKIDIGFAGIQQTSSIIKQLIEWDESKYTLQSAILNVNASQSYDSGAQLTAYLNAQAIPGSTIHWGAVDTGEHDSATDITSLLSNGENDFQLLYQTAVGTAGAEALVSASILLSFLALQPVTSSTPPASYSAPSGQSAWANFLQDVKTYFKTILAIVIIGGVFITIYKLMHQAGGYAWLRSLSNRISR